MELILDNKFLIEGCKNYEEYSCREKTLTTLCELFRNQNFKDLFQIHYDSSTRLPPSAWFVSNDQIVSVEIYLIGNNRYQLGWCHAYGDEIVSGDLIKVHSHPSIESLASNFWSTLYTKKEPKSHNPNLDKKLQELVINGQDLPRHIYGSMLWKTFLKEM